MVATVNIPDVKAITFERFIVSTDGEQLVFMVRDRLGAQGHIAINWLALSNTVQMIHRAAEKGAEVRSALGKSDNFYPGPNLTAQIVSTFQVSEYPDEKLKILSLQSPTGFRADFAIRTDTPDQLGLHPVPKTPS